MSRILLAESAGFCFGVRRAVQLVLELLEKGERVCTLGPIIHNPQLVQQLREKGVVIVDNPEEVPAGYVLVVRSHGVSRAVYDRIEASGVRMCDATCPFVSKIHRIVSEASDAGHPVLIAGDADHPEVVGIRGHCVDGAYVFRDEAELLRLYEENSHFFGENCPIIVSQTTFNHTIWGKCTEAAKKPVQIPKYMIQYAVRQP